MLQNRFFTINAQAFAKLQLLALGGITGNALLATRTKGNWHLSTHKDVLIDRHCLAFGNLV